MIWRTPDGSGHWLGWLSPLPVVWLWHALFDGTPLCRCQHSHDCRAIARRWREGRHP